MADILATDRDGGGLTISSTPGTPATGGAGQDIVELARACRRASATTPVRGLRGISRISDGGDFNQVLPDVLNWNQMNRPPLPESEVRRTVQSICQAEKSKIIAAGGTPGVSQRKFMCTDTGNAERFAAQHRGRALFCHPWKKWLIWDGRRWAPDAAGRVQRLAKQTVRSIYAETSREKDSETREAIASWAAKSEAKKNRKDMLELAQSERGMQVQPDELDADPWVLNVENGTMDLKSGRLMPHDPKNLLTKLVPVAFDPNAAAPRWEKFLREILPKDRVEFLQRWAGYSLTGDIAEEAFVFLYGTGQNGKSKFVNPIRRILGDYAKTAEKTTFMVKSGGSGIPNNLADLHGVRMIPCMEIPKGQTLNEQLIQNFTGGDPVKARFLFGSFSTLCPLGSFRSWVTTRSGWPATPSQFGGERWL